MKESIVAFVVGVIFALGLTISGMTNPQKVLSFLDITNQWDPSLAFVMIGAIGVYAIAYRWIVKRKTPICTSQFLLPTNTKIDKKLILGAALFGIGWGMTGICPGPAIVGLTTLNQSILIFFFAMVAGAILFEVTKKMVN